MNSFLLEVATPRASSKGDVLPTSLSKKTPLSRGFSLTFCLLPLTLLWFIQNRDSTFDLGINGFQGLEVFGHDGVIREIRV